MNIDWSKAPEGVKGFHPQVNGYTDHWVKWCSNGDNWFCVVGFESGGWVRASTPMHQNYMAGIVVRDQQSNEWNGSGLPPVGTVCEYLGAHQYNEWSEVKIFAAWQNLVFVDFADGWRQEGNPQRFRPLRTPEQIAAEERDKAISQMIEDTNILTGIMSDRRGMAGQLYDAGYRKIEIVEGE